MDTSFRTEYMYLGGVRAKILLEDVQSWLHKGWIKYDDHKALVKKEAEEKMAKIIESAKEAKEAKEAKLNSKE